MKSTPRPLHIIATGDVHGNYFPYDFLNDAPLSRGSLARVSQWVSDLREEVGEDNVLLLDCGDLIHGGPAAFWANRQSGLHPVAEMMKHMKYDAMTVGNHDIEAGHGVYDSFRNHLSPIPMLGGNVTDEQGGEYFSPYGIFERGGRRVAVIGLLTPAVAEWVPEKARHGLVIGGMIDSARRLVELVKTREYPDLIVGLFHSGYVESDPCLCTVGENFSSRIAEEVPGFDLIIMGHDHTPTIHKSTSGTLLADAGARAEKVVHAVVAPDGELTVSLDTMKHIEPDADFMARFDPFFQDVRRYVSQPLAYTATSFDSSDALTPDSAFMRVIHEAQLQTTGARISMAAPTQGDAHIAAGELTTADLYRFYRFDNSLMVIRLIGREIIDALEWSYELRRLYLEASGSSTAGAPPIYNLDSAYGIDYTVDYTQPRGSRVAVKGLTDSDEPWDETAEYEVALNSYRACGGGGHLTLGAGLTPSELTRRIVRTYPEIRDALARYFTHHPDYIVYY